MEAEIKALENEVAKINPPPHTLHPVVAPPDQHPSTTTPTTSSYSASRGTAIKPSVRFHPYQSRPTNTTTPTISNPSAANPASSTQVQTAAIIQQQAALQAARSAQVIAQATAARLQAQAAAITAARTRTLMSAAAQAQAQAVRAAAIAARTNTTSNTSMINSGGSNTHNNNKSNATATGSSHSHSTTSSAPTTATASVGPSYTKNNATNIYNKYGKYGGYYKGTNYKRFEYNNHYNHHNHNDNHNGHGHHYHHHHKRSTTTIPNSSLRNHDYENVAMQPANKKKKLKATHQYQLRTAANEKWVDPTMTDWPENDFRIFCGDLGNEVSDAMLTSAFSKYPSFAKAKVIRDKRTGKSKGYGFVSFLEPHDFIRAFKEMNGKYVGNRPIKLRKSKWKERMKKVKNFKIRE